MSDEENGLPSLPNQNSLQAQEPTGDLNAEDQRKLNKFVEDGMPGLALVDDPKMYRMMDLYLSGKTYTQIARALRINRTILLYLSNKFNWYLMRREFMGELEGTIRNRVLEAKVVSQDFMLQLAHLFQTKIGGKIERYLATGDDSIANEIDLKEVDKYLKIVEFLHKTDAKGSGGEKAPAVGLNLGDGVTVERVGNNKVEITPRQSTIGDMLKKFADAKRAEEKVIDSKKKN